VRAVLRGGHRCVLILGWGKSLTEDADSLDVHEKTYSHILPHREVIGLSSQTPREFFAAAIAMGRLYECKTAEHAKLFARCDCVIHHGGAGTVASVLRAGLPSVVRPVLLWYDQLGWAQLLERAGCAVALDGGTAARAGGAGAGLGAALETALSDGHLVRAAELQQQLWRERAAQRAAVWLVRYARGGAWSADGIPFVSTLDIAPDADYTEAMSKMHDWAAFAAHWAQVALAGLVAAFAGLFAVHCAIDSFGAQRLPYAYGKR